MIGGRPGSSAAAGGWDCARCIAITNPASWWIPAKSLFYCYGCGRGGDVIRFAELYHEVKFPQALALLRQWRGLAPLLHEAARFYRMQLHRHGEAVAYLHQRGIRSPELIEHMRIGYAPGGCLRGWLMQLGHPLSGSASSRLGHCRRLRRIRASHRLSAGRQSLWPQHLGFGAAAPVSTGLQGRPVWLGASPAISGSDSRRGSVRLRRIVAGRFSQRHLLAWEPISMRHQFRQLCDGPRTVYLAFDADCKRQRPTGSAGLAADSREQGIARSSASRCPRVTIRTPSSSRAATRTSSNRCWRPLSHEVPRDLSADLQQTHKVRFASSNRPPAEKLAGSIVIWIASMFAAWPTGPCAFTLTTCCTLSAGGRVSITPATLLERDLTESTLLEYLRFQSGLQPRPSGSTINAPHRRRRSRPPQRVSRRSLPDRPRISSSLFAPPPDGLGQTALGNQPVAGQGTQTQHRAALHR